MKKNKIIERSHNLAEPYCVKIGEKFRLKDVDPGDTGDLRPEDKPGVEEALQSGIQALAELQDVLYAQDRWSVLLIFQAMDAAGKDGTIKHVISGVNPQGCQVVSFKQPSSEDLDHDFMWRYMRRLPERGQIGIFNRSYYEEVLVVRVHEEILKRQQLPPELVGEKIWDDYMHAFEEAIRGTASKQTPWYVVPTDNKWFTRLVVAAAIVEVVEELNLTYPKVDAEKKKQLAAARAELAAET